jgi:hypothetical protein
MGYDTTLAEIIIYFNLQNVRIVSEPLLMPKSFNRDVSTICVLKKILPSRIPIRLVPDGRDKYFYIMNTVHAVEINVSTVPVC